MQVAAAVRSKVDKCRREEGNIEEGTTEEDSFVVELDCTKIEELDCAKV